MKHPDPATATDSPATDGPDGLPEPRNTPLTLLLVVLVSSAIAVLLQLQNPSAALIPQLATSNAVGLSIWGTAWVIRAASRRRIGRLTAIAIGVPVGIIIGTEITSLLGYHNVLADWFGRPVSNWRDIALTFLLATAASIFFWMHLRAAAYRSALETQRRRAAEAQQSETAAQLALLQAQIEPHFLFNTLANVQSMIQRDPATASAMLDHLNRYLRASLDRTRRLNATCADEIDLVEALLAIAAIRLGSRLRYRITLPSELRSAPLPPLLLQPLVENALKHGIEPAIEGGEIDVECIRQGTQLLLRVRDTGIGINDTAAPGVGLANIRSRLTSLYGDQARLSLYRTANGATCADLLLPCMPA